MIEGFMVLGWDLLKLLAQLTKLGLAMWGAWEMTLGFGELPKRDRLMFGAVLMILGSHHI